MKDSNWKECIENNSVRTVSVDTNRAQSLIETAKERIDLVTLADHLYLRHHR